MTRPIAVVGLLLCLATCAASQTPAARPMTVLNSRYELRIGEPAAIAAPRETIDFLAHAATRRVEIDGQPAPGLVVTSNQTQDQVVIAPSSKVAPGEYAVTLTATADTGEVRQASLDIVVKPRVSVPLNSTRPPVVLLTGWQTEFSNSCPIATSSVLTFGNLAQYLVADGVPVVYLFDNCLEDANQPIETLANDLNLFLQTIKYDDGTQVPQIDLIGYSIGGLIARAYLSGLQVNQTYLPPTPTLVRKLVLIATPNFGSFVLANTSATIQVGSQSAELIPGSAFLWNLASWNQHGDDLRGVDAIAIIGNAGSYTSSASSGAVLQNASDGLVSVTSASLGFATSNAALTRVVPYCHLDAAAFTNPSATFNCSAAGIANAISESHYTSQIVRSFLANTTDWQSIGTAPTADPYLSTNGGMFFALQGTNGAFVTDLTQVSWGTLQFQNPGALGTIFYSDFIFGTGTFTATSTSLSSVNCGSLPAPVGAFAAARCKLGAAISFVTPLSTTAPGRAATAGSAITVNGANFGGQCNGCQVTITPAGSSTSQTLTTTSWGNTAISAKLPAGVTGLVTLRVSALAGVDNVGVWIAGAATIAAAPANLQFSSTTGGAAPAAQTIQITNSGSGTLAWTATASQPWLTLSAASGTAPSSLSVSVSPAGLSAGTYNDTIQISATGAANTPVSIAVTLTVAAAPASLVVTPQALTFQYTVGSPVPAGQEISITNGGTGTISWTASGGAFWAALSALSGSTPGTQLVSVSPANLAAGTYMATLTIAAADPSITPVSVAVTLVVQGTQAAGSVTAAVNAGSYQPGISSGAWVSIFGSNLGQRTYTLQGSDIVNGMLPTSLQGVSVTINGTPAYIDYISPTQINVLAPDDATLGPVTVQVTTAGQTSNTVTVQKTQFSPAFLTLVGKSVAALHADYSVIGASAPAKPGETILLYGAGFGPTTPAVPSGQMVATAAPLANNVQVTIGGMTAPVSFAGLVQPGLYQFNVTVPAVPDGDATLAATIGGVGTQSGVTVAVKQ
jgi:uncharacterized protein (TIGR03437 family)